MHRQCLLVAALFAVAFACAPSAPAGTTPLGSSFSYQGALSSGGTPYNGTADFQFSLWEGGLPVDAIPQQGWLEMSTTDPDEVGR